ncbi:hypothetical protein PG991_014716 [Apiospora marii]|uniref:Heterokaryon incompatibility domain-containing protein n=1 Tax=Apiospora marii TaxID=335849 RepID=A0ABR1R4A4_9PEZI
MQHLADYGTFDDISVHRLKHESYQDNTDCSVQAFYDYPERCGWRVEQGFMLQRARHDRPTKFAPFLQSWLWFGLIHTVLKGTNGEPLIAESELAGSHSITTEHLPRALQKWADFEKRNRKDAKLRLMMAGCVLEHARRVVVANLAHNIDATEEETSDSEELARLQELPRQDSRHISHVNSLSIMVLGEALSTQRAKIMSDLGIRVQGWNEAQSEVIGWGAPKYVLLRMAQEGWCRRTVRLLRGQLSSNATLFLTALHSHDVSKGHTKLGCTAEVCKAIPAETTSGNYQQQHESDCCRKYCFPVTVHPKTKLYTIIEATNPHNLKENFPIFRYTNINGIAKLQVESWEEHHRPFTTISHIWADGLGNENQNSVHKCKLDYLSKLLERLSEGSTQGSSEWFWLDTLGIPRRSDEDSISWDQFTKIRRTAVIQIGHVFNKATQSIVIDRGLCDIDASERTAGMTMRILTSGWMRRLWTLQEAYLSRGLKIMFKQEDDDFGGILDFDDTLSSMRDTTQLLRQMLMHNTMGFERASIKLSTNAETQTRGSSMIADAWRAVRWRATSKAEDETLALATLLSLPLRETPIYSEGISSNMDSETREKLMCDFWKLVNKHYKGSIPPGIIFLHGSKLSVAGFRWAPQTWMSATVEDHPEPLNFMYGLTELLDEGLLVRFPGFMLHFHDYQRILVLGSDASCPYGFQFPVDPEFNQWYRAEAADKPNMEFLETLPRPGDEDKQLAIIVSRPHPHEFLPEIGLLVQVDDIVSTLTEGDTHKTDIIHCKMISRLKIRRMQDKERSLLRVQDRHICYAETLSVNQKWIVDGFDEISAGPTQQNETTSTGQPDDDLAPLTEIVDALNSVTMALDANNPWL